MDKNYAFIATIHQYVDFDFHSVLRLYFIQIVMIYQPYFLINNIRTYSID